MKIFDKKILFLTATIFLIALIAFFYFRVWSKPIFRLDSINNIQKYSNYYTEHYNSDNNDWEYPEFSSYYKNNLSHGAIEKFFNRIGLLARPIFDINDFIATIERVTKYRSEKNFISPFESRIKLKKDDKCIVFGDMNGALHSFARNLSELEKQKIIDNNLNIISPDTYIIFLGNVIGKSPYCLELLSIILNLMDKNKEKVFYISGSLEKESYWKNFSMRQEIKILFPEKDINNFIQNKITEFLNTLEDSVIATIQNNKNKDNEINKDNKDNKENDEKIIFLHDEFSDKFAKEKNLQIALVGEKKLDIIKELSGLEFADYDSGVAKWSLLSCPTLIYKKFLSFFKDAFVELKIGKSAATSILTLNNRDVREKEIIYSQTRLDPIFGQNLDKDGNSLEKEIYEIGSTMSTTGITAAFSREYKSGLETALFFNNKKSPFLVKPIILDDEYEPRLAKMNVEKLYNDYSVRSIISPSGTPTLALYLDMVKSGKIFVLFPHTGADIFRNSEIKNIIHFRASYTQEAKTTINYLINKQGAKNFAFFYQNDSFGTPIAKVAHEELKKAGISNWLDLPHIKTQSDFTNIIQQIKEKGPDAIALFSTNYATLEFIEQLGPEFFSGRTLFGVSLIFSDPFCKFLEDRGIKFLRTSIVPDPMDSEIEIVKEFRNNMELRGLNANQNSLEGYISSSLIVDAINKVIPPVSAKKIMEHFENMKDYELKGLKMTFNPEERSLSQPMWIKDPEKGWINYKY